MPAPINLPPRATTEALNTLDGNWLDTALGWATTVPTWIWATALAGTFLATLVAFPVLRRQAYKAGRRAAGHTTKPGNSAQDRRDRQLLTAALGPAILFWIAVLIGSARGLIGFARDDLNWTGGWEYLVPFTLDGVAVTFGFLAFRAVAKERNPDRAYRIVWMATTASAGINFLHEVNGSALGALYLAILSLFGMLIFHEFLAQFEEGAAWIKRDNPKFGLRWITWPTNTLCAWFAWRNYPPTDGTAVTIAAAVEHLRTVRAAKKTLRAERFDTAPWWTPIVPWVRIGQLDAALGEHRTDLAAERTTRTELAAQLEQAKTEHTRALQKAEERADARVEQARTEAAEHAAEQVAKIRAEHAAHVSRIREKAPQNTPTAPARTSAKTAPTAAPAEPRLSNDEAVELMLATHPEPNYEWGQREVARLTGAGFSRVPKLIAAVAEHHAREAGAGPRSNDDDAEERAS